MLLLHETPQSAHYFREVVPGLARVAYVIAPDLPDVGESDVLPVATFAAYGDSLATTEAEIDRVRHSDPWADFA